MGRVLAISVVLLCGVPQAARAESQFASTQEVTVDGVADITAGEAAARVSAIQNAQRNAVESVVGAFISSSFSQEQREVAKDAQSSFSSQVQDRIMTKSDGFIEKQKVVKEGREGGTYRVTLTASVRVSSLQQELAGLRDLLKSVNYPKVAVLVAERYTNGKGENHWIDRPAVVPAVEEILLKKTFELVAKEATNQMYGKSDGLEPLLADDGKLAQLAGQVGADVVIAGISDVKFSAFNEFNDNLYYVAALVNLRAINARNGKVLASFSATGKAAGVSEDLARVKAVSNATPEVADKLISGLVRVWKQEADEGQRFRVSVAKVRNYGKQGRPLLKAMQALPNVNVVKELSYSAQKLEFEVLYKGKKEDLLDGIFDKISGKKEFRKLDKVSDAGDRIDLSL